MWHYLCDSPFFQYLLLLSKACFPFGFWIRVIYFVPFKAKQISSFGSSLSTPFWLGICLVYCALCFYFKFLKWATLWVTHLGHFYFFLSIARIIVWNWIWGIINFLHSKFLFLINVIYFMFHLMCIWWWPLQYVER